MSSRPEKDVEQFLTKWNSEKSVHEKWGQFVSEEATTLMSVAPTVQIPVTPGFRTKEDKSLLTKAFYRNKPYADPWSEIEDKVGVRIVVVNDSEVARVRDKLVQCTKWSARVDRDLTQSEMSDPNVFEYTACHVICTSNGQNEGVPNGIPCEVQIKTLLQLAWGEVSHHTIYKPIIQADWSTAHAIAKGKALVDIASDYFASVYHKVDDLIGHLQESTRRAATMYEKYITPPPRLTELEGRILKCIEPILEKTRDKELESWVEEIMKGQPDLPDKIATRAIIDPFFAQPSIISLYALVRYRSASVEESEHAPLVTTIDKIKRDMGIGGTGI